MALQQVVEQVVSGLSYDLVEITRSAGGLLRVTIDVPWVADGVVPKAITVEDCEVVTRQLQFALEVDGATYQRLEVSSPGIDRLLRNEQDFLRFAGQVVDVTLRSPMGAAAQGQVSPLRKKFRGVLSLEESNAESDSVARVWRIEWVDEPVTKPGQRVSKKRPLPPVQVLSFMFDELREARLAPIVNFKGRGA